MVLSVFSLVNIEANTPNNKIVYFHSELCGGCNTIKGYRTSTYNEAEDYIKKIEDAGIEIIKIDVDNELDQSLIPDNITHEGPLSVEDLRDGFGDAYDVPLTRRGTPLMFVGETYYYDYQEIMDAFDNGDLLTNAEDNFLEFEVESGQAFSDYEGWQGYLTVLLFGLLDGFNPCAIALLLMFISLLGFTDNKKVLTVVSITYILTMFISYLLLGLGVLSFLRVAALESGLDVIISWVILIIVTIFFVLNTYDYFVTRNEEYGKIKSQIPKWLQRFNSRIMKTFTNAMNDENSKGNMWKVVLLTAVLGLIMTLTEFTCSGGLYAAVLEGVKYSQSSYAYIALVSFNVMFVMPMIVIAYLSIKSRSTMSISNWMRENLHIIKLANAIVFLFLAIFFVFRILGYDLFHAIGQLFNG